MLLGKFSLRPQWTLSLGRGYILIHDTQYVHNTITYRRSQQGSTNRDHIDMALTLGTAGSSLCFLCDIWVKEPKTREHETDSSGLLSLRDEIKNLAMRM